MTKKPVALLVALVLATLTLSALAQPKPRKFGAAVTKADLAMQVYPQDSGAAAVYLLNSKRSEYSQSRNVVITTYHYLIKILDAEAYELADNSLLISPGSFERFMAATHNLEGGKKVSHQIKKKDLTKEKVENGLVRYTWLLENIKKGSIIEVQYSYASNLGASHGFQFQQELPVRLADYYVNLPNFLTYKLASQGYYASARDENYSVMGSLNRYMVFENLPAFKEEPYMASKWDYYQRLRIEIEGIQLPGYPYKQLIGNWQDIAKLVREKDEYKQLDNMGFAKSVADRISTQHSSAEDRMKAVHEFVVNNIEWNKKGGVLPGTAMRKLFVERKGSAADINYLMVGLLRKVGLTAHPMLLSTRSHGLINPSIALLGDLNYAIAYVQIGDKVHLLDATQEQYPCGMLPPRCLNGEGLVVTPAAMHWQSLAPAHRYSYLSQATLGLEADGTLSGTLIMQHAGYDGARARGSIAKNGMNEYLAKVAKRHPNWTLENPQLENRDDPSKALKETYSEVEILEAANVSGNFIYVQPCLNALEENPFKNPSRLYPVDYDYPEDETFVMNLTLPEGYTVESLPQPANMAMPGRSASFRYSAAHQGNMVQITYRLSIKKTNFTPQEYPNLREFYSQVIQKQAEQIVLKKL